METKIIKSHSLISANTSAIVKLALAWLVGITSEVFIVYNLFENLYSFSLLSVAGYSIDKAFISGLAVYTMSVTLAYALREQVRLQFFFTNVPVPKLSWSSRAILIGVLLCSTGLGLLNGLYILEEWRIEGFEPGAFLEVGMIISLALLSICMLALSAVAGASLMAISSVQHAHRRLTKVRRKLAFEKGRKAFLDKLNSENERQFKQIEEINKQLLRAETLANLPIDLNAFNEFLKEKK